MLPQKIFQPRAKCSFFDRTGLNGMFNLDLGRVLTSDKRKAEFHFVEILFILNFKNKMYLF